LARKAKILIVEDSPTQIEQLKYILEQKEYRVSVANNGKEALALIKKRKPNIIVSDIVMPEMDGYELCRQIRRDVNLKDIPVILLTALSDPADVIKGLECGANNFITKPLDKKYLLTRLDYIITNLELRKESVAEMGINIFFGKKKYFITAERLQILDFLLGTYETAVQRNYELRKTQDELRKTQDKLRSLNEQLEQKVEERTAYLSTEITERKRVEKELKRLYTELKESQFQLIQAEKMSAVGTFVAGVAHELNNPITAILHFVQYCIKHTSKEDRLYSILQDIERETRSYIDTTQNLLTFSHMQREKKVHQKESLNTILNRVLKLLSYRIEKNNISVSKNISIGVPDIPMNVNNIQQVFLNLLNNALDALKESKRKKIDIDILCEGKYVKVTIADSGCGITPENIDNIFDPFFTTKPIGQGTGLGLSLCQSIINAHNGEITCESVPGQGTKFIILLPVTAKDVKGATAEPQKAQKKEKDTENVTAKDAKNG